MRQCRRWPISPTSSPGPAVGTTPSRNAGGGTSTITTAPGADGTPAARGPAPPLRPQAARVAADVGRADGPRRHRDGAARVRATAASCRSSRSSPTSSSGCAASGAPRRPAATATTRRRVALFEHEYALDLKPEVWQALSRNVAVCLRNFFRLPLAGRRSARRRPSTGRSSTGPRSFSSRARTVWMAPDFGFWNDDGRLALVDWKTGGSTPRRRLPARLLRALRAPRCSASRRRRSTCSRRTCASRR